MNYLRWYRSILNLPVANEIKLTLIEPTETGIHRLHIEGNGAACPTLMARKSYTSYRNSRRRRVACPAYDF